MGIYLPNMEMPKDCLHCPFSYMSSDCLKIWIICKVKDVSVSDGDAVQEGRPDWCPLVEVPKHGDLIDRDELDDWFYATPIFTSDENPDVWKVIRLDDIDNAPTVIGAEVET